jgi:ribosome-associated protein
MAKPATLAPAAVAHRAAQLVQDMKAHDVVLLDLKGVTDMTDFFLIATGTSDTHVRSIAQHVEQEMRKAGAAAHHVEGAEQGRWALLDFVDVVVHVFHPTLRQFYQLERLWGDAREVPLDQDASALHAAEQQPAAAR